MTRDELKAWRKEARRVRNRESAAASRQKNRERITELESEVDCIKSKYAAALQMILHLEANRSIQDCTSFTPPALLRQDLMDLRGGQKGGFPAATRSRPESPMTDAGTAAPQAQTVSPPLSPATPCVTMTNSNELLHLAVHQRPTQDLALTHKQHHHQHIIDMISRPIACV
jgi:hypothetical protein